MGNKLNFETMIKLFNNMLGPVVYISVIIQLQNRRNLDECNLQ